MQAKGAREGGARKSARPKRFNPPPNPRVPAFKRYATLFTTAPRPSFFLFLPSSPLATTSLVCDDKLDLISRLLSCHSVLDTFLHTFNYSPPLLILKSTMPFVVSAWYR